MYLRGIQYSEMESIIQFIYLGEATFYKERMDELLAVAKSLEIKGLCNAESETNEENESDDDPSTNNQDISTELVEKQTVISENITNQAQQERKKCDGKYECDQCQKICSSRSTLFHHRKSVHKGVRYACNQCDYQANRQDGLKAHIQSKHEGVKYSCDQCDYQASQRGSLRTHIKSKHEYVKYA